MDFGALKQKKQLIKRAALMYCAAQGAKDEAEQPGPEEQPAAEPPVQGLLIINPGKDRCIELPDERAQAPLGQL